VHAFLSVAIEPLFASYIEVPFNGSMGAPSMALEARMSLSLISRDYSFGAVFSFCIFSVVVWREMSKDPSALTGE